MGAFDRDVLPIWGVLAAAALAAIAWCIRVEYRSFAARGKAAPWLWVRLAGIPIAMVTVAAVILPARAVRGPEALAAFYLLMFTGGPAVYFGLHWLVGKVAGLATSESMGVAGTGLAIVLGPLLLAQFAQPWVFMAARSVQEMRFERAPERPFPYRVAAQQRFAMPEVGEVWTEHWQVPPGVKVERIEVELRGVYSRVEGGTSGMLCRSGQDVHVLWMAAVAAPRWRVHWSDAAGDLARASWASVPPQVPAVPFEVRWLPDGFVLPARVAREVAALGRTWPDGREQVDGLGNLYQPGETIAETCLPLEYRRLDAAKEPPVTSFSLRFWRWDTQQALRPTFRRPAAGS